jgi:AcrR family transcriptional regulator
MPSNTRQRLTAIAMRRFYREGFRNVGLDQVLAEVGISKTAFYKHFSCKEDLVLAALKMQNGWLQDAFRRLAAERGGPSAINQLRALMDVVEHLISADDFQGCIFINVAMEFPLLHEPAHMAAAQHKQAIEDLVHELATRAGAPDPRALAQELCLLMEGAYVTRQVTGNKQSIEVARRLADLVIDAHLPEAARRVKEHDGAAGASQVARRPPQVASQGGQRWLGPPQRRPAAEYPNVDSAAVRFSTHSARNPCLLRLGRAAQTRNPVHARRCLGFVRKLIFPGFPVLCKPWPPPLKGGHGW